MGKVESYGLEVDTSYRATPELMLELSGGYNPVEPTVLSPNTAPGIGNVGEQFQRAPEWSYRAAATYTQPLSSTLTLELNGAVNAVGPTRFCGEAARVRSGARSEILTISPTPAAHWSGRATGCLYSPAICSTPPMCRTFWPSRRLLSSAVPRPAPSTATRATGVCV